jgi:hypothetical protein
MSQYKVLGWMNFLESARISPIVKVVTITHVAIHVDMIVGVSVAESDATVAGEVGAGETVYYGNARAYQSEAFLL